MTFTPSVSLVARSRKRLPRPVKRIVIIRVPAFEKARRALAINGLRNPPKETLRRPLLGTAKEPRQRPRSSSLAIDARLVLAATRFASAGLTRRKLGRMGRTRRDAACAVPASLLAMTTTRTEAPTSRADSL